MPLFTEKEKAAMSAIPPSDDQVAVMVKRLQGLPRGLPISAGERSKVYSMDLLYPPATDPEAIKHPGQIICVLFHPYESDPRRTSMSYEEQRALGYSIPAVPIIDQSEYGTMTSPQILNFLGQSLVGDVIHTFVDFRPPMDTNVMDPLLLRGHEVAVGQQPEGFIVHDLAIAKALLNHEYISRFWGSPQKRLFSVCVQPRPGELDKSHKDHYKRLVTFCSVPTCAKMKNVAKLKRCSRCNVAYYCSKECQMVHHPIHKPLCKRAAAAFKESGDAWDFKMFWLEEASVSDTMTTPGLMEHALASMTGKRL